MVKKDTKTRLIRWVILQQEFDLHITDRKGAENTLADNFSIHYCGMLLTRHYDQRPFDETVCDAIIANGGVKNYQKGAKCLRWRMHQTRFRFLLRV